MDPAPGVERRLYVGGTKVRNGLYLKSIVADPDQVVFEVFASRRFRRMELENLALRDDQGTTYTRIVDDELEGDGQIVFKPTLPEGALFSLSQPGWALNSYRLDDKDPG